MSNYYYLLIRRNGELEGLVALASTLKEGWGTGPNEVLITGITQTVCSCDHRLFISYLDFICINAPLALARNNAGKEDLPKAAAVLREYPYLIEIENKYKGLITADKASHLQGELLQIAFGLYDSLKDMEKSHLRLLSLISGQGDLIDRIEGELAFGSMAALFGSLPSPAAEPVTFGAIMGSDDRFSLTISLPDRALLDEANTYRMAWDDFFSSSIAKTNEFYYTLYQAIYEVEVRENWAFYNDVKNSYPQIADSFYPEYLRRRVEDHYNELDYPLEGQPGLTFRKMINSVEDYFKSNRINPSARSLS
jgi:hypothetical protein